MDVGEWLKGLGLGEYEDKFRHNKIDADVLADLSDGDLEKLGLPLGDRKRFLKAVAGLAAPSSAVTRPEPAQTQPPASTPTHSTSAERRPITVMFCDLVGSTALAAKLDAEDWRSLVNAYLDEASAAVTGLGGHVLKRLGDGLMALFGYPQAQENDAERAVRAALAIQRALAELNARNAGGRAPQLAARVGLDSGRVVVDATGEVFGEAPNIAARVQALAEPGAVVVTTNVHNQVAGLFVADDKGEHDLKGVPRPVALYRIVRASGGRRGGARTLTPLVGREEELDHLARRWERALKGDGQLALVVGEPGIGKSRLIEEFRLKLGESPHTFVEWSSSQLLQNTPLHPIAEWGRQRFGAETLGDQRLADLENTLQLIGLDPAEYARLLAPLVEIPLPPERAAKLAPQELRRRQLAAMTAWVLAGARSQPVVLAFEDLHWADPTSLDLMQALAERGAQAPLLILATARPEFRPPWSLRSHHSLISLSPLDRADVAQMVGELAARHALSKEVVEGVSERTGGVPLFVEEVTRLLLERGVEGGVQAIPPTLQQSLAARLDRLGAAREIAQIGAVLGRGFSLALLRAVAGVDEPALQSALDRLAEADILIAEGAGEQASYRFKHALIQDAAYESLLKSRRQPLHRRAAEVLCESASPEAETIAHHFTAAGLDDLAIEWWGKAGDQALRRSAFQEAISHLGKAIEMADRAGDASTPGGAASQRSKLQLDYGRAVMWTKGFAADATREALERSDESGAQAKSTADGLSADTLRFLRSFVGGELPAACEIAQDFVRRADEERNAAAAAHGRRLLGMARLCCGELVEAKRQLELALSEPDLALETDSAAPVLDIQASASGWLAITSWQLGDIDAACGLKTRAIELADQSADPVTIVNARWWETILEVCRDHPIAAQRAARALAEVARRHGMAHYISLSEIIGSWANGRLHDPAAAADALHSALASYWQGGNRICTPWFHGLLAELEFAAYGAERALASIDRGLEIAKETGDHFCEAFLFRLSGDIWLKQVPGDSSNTERSYRAAIDVAKQQGARSFELLASLSLAKLYQSTNRPVEAHAVLSDALEGFAPTPEMAEIAEAQALLAALGETNDVKAAAASRQRRLQLQTRFGQAMMLSRGYASDESKTAFARARTLAAGVGDASERFDAYYGLYVSSNSGGDLRLARETAEGFLREAENEGRMTEAAVARRCVGFMHLLRGDFVAAEADLAEALKTYDPGRDRDARFRFGADGAAAAAGYLAMANWALGDVERARPLGEEALARADETAHAPTRAFVHHFVAIYQMLRRDPEAVRRIGTTMVDLSREHGMALWLAFGEMESSWARARLGDRETEMAELRRALAAFFDTGNKLFAPLFQGLLAELEAEGQDVDGALTRIDEALALANETGERWTDALLHRIRGKILWKRDPTNPAPAEEAFLASISVAQAQKARSFELQAALPLAKLYQSTARPLEAHAVLSEALEGFSPTPEMPEIAEAQALMGQLG
jgi:class 3 adenylate cyclase/predicted ATPase